MVRIHTRILMKSGTKRVYPCVGMTVIISSALAVLCCGICSRQKANIPPKLGHRVGPCAIVEISNDQLSLNQVSRIHFVYSYERADI
ncbi:hypothetical protein AMTR_s00029p00199630 [Amborella trichopoda]|uniref:Uncharacterized protein n=1 Tax=Amborella trichopoda TaxID=13333 RepID=W1PPJ9_AMBTC|nr:hypothetical protein AMTR_s00029p00199630 [Amborella trichopoda]